MAIDIQTLERRYVGSCQQQGNQPNKAILVALFKAKVEKAHHEDCNLVIYMDDVKDVDFNPLVRLLMEIDESEINGVDILQRSSCFMSVEHVLFLLHIIRKKLRVVDLLDMSFGKKFLLDISQRGLTCQVLNLRSSHFRKLNMTGNFMQMHTLNLDFSTSLSSFQESCFACMPKLRCLSLCETRVSNLWTTSAALNKLTSLIELRFQNSLCADDIAGSCQGSSGVDAEYSIGSGHLESVLPAHDEETMDQYFSADGEMDLFPMDMLDFQQELHSTPENPSDESEEEFSGWGENFFLNNLFTDDLPWWNEMIDPESQSTSFGSLEMQIEEDYATVSSSSRNISYTAPTKYISSHPSPICFEKHYREYMIASLPNLRILDNLPIRKIDRDTANIIFSENFEYLPYKRKNEESLVSILQSREMAAGGNFNHRCTRRPFYSSGKSQSLYSRSLSAAKLGSSAWPFLRPLSVSGSVSIDDRRKFRPRQFEYHPSNSSLMVFGTLDGEVVAINHESEKIVSYIPSLGAMNSVLGLSWLKKYPSKLIAGSDNGSLKLYDIQHAPSTTTGIHHNVSSVSYVEFDQLTSVHVNSTDELFLASGYSKDVALYDISSGKRIQVFTDMHRQHINVVKFANHSPSLFATSSFDQDIKMWDLRQKPVQPCYTTSSCRGNVMVCFSPDDHYLLASAIDNEVKQFLAVDGRLHLDFEIASTGSTQNYTRSYYMNGRDYVISGSCDENVVRICCAQTGRRLRDITFNGKGSRTSMFVQSLRSDPYRDFNMSILAAYSRPGSNSEILKVNLLASRDYDKEYLSKENRSLFCSMGG
ncbi:LRRcap domain-containing protein [Heracleum sosnowskyi]|uniref:LRRcap domain-containing protein n=1 Tax=Heracleum sosnowskyi TaxID=360622 RepID=A0AAD8J165_9APIA|nr:LRRcap domain-containing protein [Heracleum sosnowskyi]